MKKLLCIFVAVCLAVGSITIASAYGEDRPELGISLSVPDGWYETTEGDSYYFYHMENDQESIAVEITKNYPLYSIELVDEASLMKICNDTFSDEKMSKELSDLNGIPVKVVTGSEVAGYEYYNGIKYFRFEKAYTAIADGYDDTSLYDTMFITVKNGRMYRISYKRDDVSNHFANVLSLINSISYYSGEIKIFINGERISPDSAPLIIDSRTVVPIRAIAEKMGYSVQWNDATKTVTLISADGGTNLQFTIGKNVAVKNSSEAIALDVPARIYSDRTYLPLRAVAEAMSADVKWNDSDRAVEITK
ncbi:MAG: copper amine oxidase N-terminal domain-containing protein [Clostridia bacterium]|nr:copper amine oxidase N-terminal domain-containing protein [Clostridia bacterium]